MTAGPVLGTNVTATPDRYRDRVAEELEEIRGRDDPVDYARHAGRGKEVPRVADQRGVIVGGKSYSLGRVFASVLLVVVGFVTWSLVLAL